ncbi:MAG: PTS sugar transporter subunit IIC/EAL domain-containing protein [Bacilli bacterium]|nr:PTS sugar transporter subunit IIC/EAL domain-containing protein [Bacilli bacterium]
MNSSSKLLQFASKAQQTSLIKSIRNGLVNMIPVLIIGAFALIFKTFPVPAYQTFITNFAGGFLLELFDFVYSASFGVLSVYMTFSISRSFMKIKAGPNIVHGGAIFASILVFFILSGALLPDFGLNNMGPKSMLLAIIAGLGASALYIKIFEFFQKRRRYILSSGADRELNKMLSTLFPIFIVVISFALVNIIIIRIFNKESFHDLYISLLNSLFSHGNASFLKGFFFVLLSSILWFFGVHGSDALEGVMQNYFTPGLALNQAAIEAGVEPTSILTKEFFDCFVLMGGCGAAICLLIAILIFSKNRARRGLGLTAAFPMIFNINELMVFGLPIIFNPLMLIPFLTVPLVCYTSAYIAISTGIVPMITSEVAWTTPVIMGGYYATGSVAGSLLQVFNIALGIAIYFPFIKILDRQSIRDNQENYEKFVLFFKENEQQLQNEKIIELNSLYGDFAKELCADLRHDLLKNMEIFYQPQYDYNNKCIGVEALLRWRHPDYDYLYPPIVIKLATECDLLQTLEEEIILRVYNEKEDIYKKYGEGIKISINVTGTTIVKQSFIDFLLDINKNDPFKDKNICLEITEKEAIELNTDTFKILDTIKELGIKLAIDDFSMGQTSIHYLQYNLFDIIKIDGGLVKGINNSPNCREIISSISELAGSLSMMMIAEVVETEEEKESLHKIGCDVYQGYLYSSAKPLKEE